MPCPTSWPLSAEGTGDTLSIVTLPNTKLDPIWEQGSCSTPWLSLPKLTPNTHPVFLGLAIRQLLLSPPTVGQDSEGNRPGTPKLWDSPYPALRGGMERVLTLLISCPRHLPRARPRF